MKLEKAIQTNNFKSEVHKASLNVMYSSWWLKTLNSKCLKEHDFTHEQFNVMRILKGKYPENMSIKDIASRMIEQNSNVPRIIERLLKKKWITRTQCQNDGRHTKIGLTDLGIHKLQAVSLDVEANTNTKINLTVSEALLLNELLEKMKS